MTGKEPACKGGQVMVLMLLGLALLGGLVFYVVNSGDQTNRRVVVQNAADSSAISGATWMAKSFNLIAMNNVAQTRVLALVPVLDAFPLATQMSYEETRDWEASLRNQLTRGVPDSWLKDGLESLRQRIQNERDILGAMNDLFNNSDFHMDSLTLYNSNGQAPYGELWQAAEAMDNFSLATMMTAPVLAQENAVRFGKASDADVAFISPVEPTMPAFRGFWGQFEQPVKKGRIPDRVYAQRLGPYDRLFKWRDYQYENITERGAWVPPTQGHGAISNVTGRANIPGGRSNGQGAMGQNTDHSGFWAQNVVGRILKGYTTYGPYEWMMRRIHGYSYGWWNNNGFAPGQLSDTYFHEYHRQIGNIKLGYMWGAQDIRSIHYPKYVIDYPQAAGLAAQNPGAVNKTMVYLVEIRSKYRKDDPSFMTPGTFVTNDKLPVVKWMNGWQDPNTWGIPQIVPYIWEDQWQYMTTQDVDIGIQVQRDATGQPVWQNVYMVSQYVFGGIDIGPQVQVSNPANYASQADLPAPVLLDLKYGDYDLALPDHDQGVRRDVFTYLGVARKGNTPPAWSDRFGKDSPYKGMVAAAQAEIFNTTSWDLWTQDWKTQLVPVTQWQNWVAITKSTAHYAGDTMGLLSDTDVVDIADYMSRFSDPMAADMLKH
jgi:hypothetical protein